MKKKNETFSMMVILLIPVAIAINIVGGQMTSILKIPVPVNKILFSNSSGCFRYHYAGDFK